MTPTGEPESVPAAVGTPRAERAPAVRRRSQLEIRWRQFRHAPRPVVRAVMSSLVVAVVAALGYLAYDLAIRRGAPLPGGDLRILFVTVYAVVVLVAGSVVTWLIVPAPTGSRERAARSGWSAALGLFAAVPICYLVIVVVVQVIEPVILGG